MTDDPKAAVRDGYDRVSYAYRGDDGAGAEEYEAHLGPILRLVPAGSAVLELGCGAGIPGTRLLASRFDVTGVDISPVQIERARRLVPEARFLVADMTTLDVPAATFSAVVALYAIIHVPRAEQPALFRAIHRWLVPGGYLLATVGYEAWEGTEDDWLGAGARMYWSHADEETYRRWLGEAGFEIVERRFVPEGTSGHVLVLARRSG